MTSNTGALRMGRLLGGVAALSLALGAGQALAQSAADAQPSENLAINLIELLVKQGVISRTAADQLLKQAEAETAQARAASAGAEVMASASPPAQGGALPPPPPGVVRVPYVPQIVRNQIRDEIKGEVMQQAKDEGWAQPGALPDWLGRVSLSGDMRFRSQYNVYSSANATGLIDFASFNANGPTDINPDTNPNGLPYLNSRRDNFNNLSIRARLAVNATLSDSLGAGIRIATGDNTSPVSTTTLLNGGFAKNGVWLDRGFVWLKPTDGSTLTAGRMPNPFAYTDLLFSDDLNFDGVSGRFVRDEPRRDMKLSLVGGAFPIGFQAASFPTNSDLKLKQSQKWLFAAQAGIDWDPLRFDWKTTAAYYDFSDMRGRLSAPCALYNGNRQCSTDFSAPAFMQKGNTLFLIRDVTPNPANPDSAQPQLAGLRFNYQLFNLNSVFDYRVDQTHHLVFTGDYVRNVAYNSRDLCRDMPLGLPVNGLTPSAKGNTDPCDLQPSGDTKARFKSGPNAWLVRLLYGDPDPVRFGEWNITAGYRFIEPDALPDGFNSADFHLGGTNAKGYTLTTTIGLYSGAYLQARWFSADEVYGPPLAIDVGQLDLHVRF
jgi:hypothetical protein